MTLWPLQRGKKPFAPFVSWSLLAQGTSSPRYAVLVTNSMNKMCPLGPSIFLVCSMTGGCPLRVDLVGWFRRHIPKCRGAFSRLNTRNGMSRIRMAEPPVVLWRSRHVLASQPRGVQTVSCKDATAHWQTESSICVRHFAHAFPPAFPTRRSFFSGFSADSPHV